MAVFHFPYNRTIMSETRRPIQPEIGRICH
jgi:hypothetical protein